MPLHIKSFLLLGIFLMCKWTVFRVIRANNVLVNFHQSADGFVFAHDNITNGISLIPPTCIRNRNIGCLTSCSQEVTNCTGVRVNTETGECIGFSSEPIFDENGHFQLLPSNRNWTSWTKYQTDKWTLAFKATKNLSLSLYDIFTGNDVVNEPTADHLSLENECNGINGCWYKHPLVENWSNVDITEVKFSLYENGEEVLSLIFDGVGSNKVNWFTQARLLSSPWTDLATSITNYFSIAGHIESRRFFINRSYDGCQNDFGWLVLVDVWISSCAWDTLIPGRKYLYSKSTTAVRWQVNPDLGPDVGVASVMAIFVKFKAD